MRDFFDADVFQGICEKYGVAGTIQNDIFLAVSADGFRAFRKKSYDIWPIVAIICNLPPHLRYSLKNMLPLAFIPGPTEPKNLQSFFEPFIREIEDTNEGDGVEFTFFDGVTRRIRLHILWFAGDLPAVKKLSGIKGHNGKRPCRFCLIAGIWSEAHRHSYYSSKMREDEYSDIITLFDAENLPLRTVEESLTTISELAELTGRSRTDQQIATGITQGSVVFRLPSIIPYASFPIDIMHLFYNIGKDMIRLWCSEGNEAFVLSRGAIRTIDEEPYAFGDGIASQMRCRPRPLRLYKDWKFAEVKEFILSYSLVVLDGILPEQFLSGSANFVALVDLCWRPVLEEQDIVEIGHLSRKFVAHFESDYYQYDRDRIYMCKYVFHLLLHLEDTIRECGPPSF